MISVDEMNGLIDGYFTWLKDKTATKKIGQEWFEITTPHLDRHNDCIQFYVRQEGRGYLLTDDGYTIQDLICSGCSIDSPKRQEILRTTLAGFGVKLVNEELQIHATRDNFSMKKHNLVQAMLAVNDLFCLSSPYVSSLFHEDVVNWLELSDIRYTPNIKFTGKSGYDHMFDFVVPKSRQQPERLIHTINQPQKKQAEVIIFKWIDTKETRSPDSALYVIINDTVGNTAPVIEALRSYDLVSVLWSQREEARLALAA